MKLSDGKPSSRKRGKDRRRHFNPADDEKYRQHLAIQAYYHAAERGYAEEGAAGEWPKAGARIAPKAGSTAARPRHEQATPSIP